jgi:hypothetical protein
VAVNKSVAIGVGVPAAVVAVILVAKWYGAASFAEAVAAGDFQRAERSASVLALNERPTSALIAVGLFRPMLIAAMLAE